MAKRGPKSAADLSEVVEGPWVPGEMASPSPELSLEMQEVWRSIAAGMPPEWSRDMGTGILLKELCRHVVFARRLSADVEAVRAEINLNPNDGRLRRQWHTLLRAYNLQTQRIGDLSTKLRLTRQSRQGARRGDQIARQGSSYPEPWTDWAGNRDDDTKQ
jgi:hypothetical protein